ncbi:MAG: hypothetical protein M3220_06910 [Chloroflexota bacterium]|nr:hypothetical protein [Chloroflexota bacterium]
MTRISNTLTLLLLMVVLLVSVVPATAAPATQAGADWAIPNGHFYTETAGGQGGFSVVDDSQARFWSEFQRLGGLQNVGYPISRRFVYDGFVTQAFQKLVLQWRPEVGQAWPVNVFDELSRKGFDDRLHSARQTPYPLHNFDPPGASWEQIVRNRQALLDANPAIRARYFAAADPLNVYGLPVSRVEDMGNHYAVRTQRAVFQQWKESVPWASQGQVTIANGGDIGKELGWLAGPYLQPEPSPQASTTWEVESLVVGADAPNRLYALEVAVPGNTSKRLMVSDDLGTSWRPFNGPLPVEATCLWRLSMDYAAPGALYATTCQGLYRWTGNAWTKLSSEKLLDIAIAYRQPQVVWGARAAAPGEEGGVLRSTDGGKTWEVVTSNAYYSTLGLDPRDNDMLYAVTQYRGNGWPSLRRGDGSGEWENLPSLDGLQVNNGITIDGQSGDLYVTTTAVGPVALWRSTNPRAENVDEVRWQKVHDFGPGLNVKLLASKRSNQGLTLFASFDPLDDQSPAQLHRSHDGGQSWQPLTIQ